jgi:glycerol-3-phosphate dehydrogenase (NAD(P)+)
VKTTRKITVIGGGAWATALALVALRAGNACMLWARDEAVVEEINSRRTNERHLPGIVLDEGLDATVDIMQALDGTHAIVLATPAQTVGEIAGALSELVRPGTVILNSAKGIDRETGMLPGETAGETLSGCPVATLSGPSFAADVARGLPTAVTIAAHDMTLAEHLCASLSSRNFRCYASTDTVGVELGGALKNVMAIAVGAVRGLKLGASAEAALVARGYAELSRLAVARGADPRTLTGLSGLGDLVLTCSGPQSRNFAYGMAIARRDPLERLPLAEGVFSAEIAASLARENRVETPIIDAVRDIIASRITPRDAVRRLMERPLRPEAE